MTTQTPVRKPKLDPNQKLRGADKLARIPVKITPTENPLEKPDWLRIKLPTADEIKSLNNLLKGKRLHSVCEEARCPNLAECFSHKTASFMIMGDRCTRRCSFCDVAHGRPKPLDTNEPQHLAETVKELGLRYVVITSVDRDDLRDGGAGHFAECIQAIREQSPQTKVEILVPDFRGRMAKALELLTETPCDVFNHNIETVPSLYQQARPGSDYQWSLLLLKEHKNHLPHIPTKSGLMLGLGESNEEVEQVLYDLRQNKVDRVTIGQYLQPSKFHMPVDRYVTPEKFKELATLAKAMGFEHVASGPLVRSSYHADLQAQGDLIE